VGLLPHDAEMRAIRRGFAAQLVFAAVCFAIAAGCSGPRTGEVHGKVTCEGKAVTEGLVTLLNPKGGGDAEAHINKDGTFAVKRVVVGEYLVVITPPMEIVDADPGKSPPSPVEKAAPNIPRKYRQQGTTTLKAEVKEGNNAFEFDMTKAP
jgi:hypothetical protein